MEEKAARRRRARPNQTGIARTNGKGTKRHAFARIEREIERLARSIRPPERLRGRLIPGTAENPRSRSGGDVSAGGRGGGGESERDIIRADVYRARAYVCVGPPRSWPALGGVSLGPAGDTWGSASFYANRTETPVRCPLPRRRLRGRAGHAIHTYAREPNENSCLARRRPRRSGFLFLASRAPICVQLSRSIVDPRTYAANSLSPGARLNFYGQFAFLRPPDPRSFGH